METRSLSQLYDLLPEDELVIVDVLRQLIKEHLPEYCKEKLSYGVPYFYGRKGICIVWPSTVPRGGIKSGVLLGFSHGNKLHDVDSYLEHGNNKQVYYKIYHSVEEINVEAVVRLLKEAVELDGC